MAAPTRNGGYGYVASLPRECPSLATLCLDCAQDPLLALDLACNWVVRKHHNVVDHWMGVEVRRRDKAAA